MRASITGSMLDDPLAATMLEDPFDASLEYPPYPGLRPFASAEWPIFFGRETMTDEIIGLVTKKHLVVVHGDSGSGKSSIVRAGVLVQLQQGHAATDASWRTCAMLPRDDPLGNLARALAGLLADEPTPDQILDVRHILNRGRRAPETLARLLRQGESDHICILVDQFEELFSFAIRRGPEEARLFVDILVGLQENPPPGLYAILTMRSEFLGHCARYESLAEAVNRTQYLLPRMERPALLRAIREPATLYGGEVTLELAERMIADAGGEQDQLPLIQHGLMRLWRRKGRPATGLAEAATSYAFGELRESAARYEIDEAPLSFGRDEMPAWQLGLEDYGSVGGLAALLSDHADEVLAEAAPDPERRKIAEHLFRALTDINAEGQAIRRPQTFAELVAVTGSDKRTLEAIIDHFRAEGIYFLTPYGDVSIKADTLIDISHEALIRCWRKIADDKDGWLQREFKDGLIWRSLIVQAQSFERDPKSVLSPARTEELGRWLEALPAPDWCKRYGGGWADVQRLMGASREARQEEEQRQRDLERYKRREAEERARWAERVRLRRLVICLDGVWNAPDYGHATNVVKIWRSIPPIDEQHATQITFYNAGVGADGRLDRVVDLVTGRGLEQNVRDGYRFLAHNWRPGDEIYIFGFSRGAFTARSLCGFIGLVGVLPKQHIHRLADAWYLYRKPKDQRDQHDHAMCRELRALSGPVSVKCLGVWETVGARGVPSDMLHWASPQLQIHDAELSDVVECAFHALAIDEKRGPFGPVLWQKRYGKDLPKVVEQVWFPGAHSNVGGGWSDTSLSDLALIWMIRRVQANSELAFDEAYIKDELRPDPLGSIYDSRSALYAMSRIFPYHRLIGQNAVQGSLLRRLVTFLPGAELRTNRPHDGCEFVNEMIHWSALQRFGQIAREDGELRLYEPGNLKAAIGRLPIADERVVEIEKRSRQIARAS